MGRTVRDYIRKEPKHKIQAFHGERGIRLSPVAFGPLVECFARYNGSDSI